MNDEDKNLEIAAIVGRMRPYSTSLRAMYDAETYLINHADSSLTRKYRHRLIEITRHTDTWHVDAADKSDAFILTFDKWED